MSISCCRGLWGRLCTFENFDQNCSIFFFFDIIISLRFDLKFISIHRSHDLGPLWPFSDIRKFWLRFLRIFRHSLFCQNRSEDYFSSSISFCRNPLGPFWTFKNFDQIFFEFLDIHYFVKHGFKNHFSTSISCCRSLWALFGHSKIMTKFGFLMNFRTNKECLICC